MSENERLFKGHKPVLVLDDEIEITKSVARDLRKQAEVQGFTRAHDALAELERKPFAVIVSDLQMPEMNGIEFLARAAEIQPQSQRILLTAFADLAHVEDSINKAQLHRLLTKPWETADLQEAVRTAQRNFELLSENAELRKLALTDSLTGLANPRYFWERMESEFSRAQRYSRPLSLIMGDVDNFKLHNDRFGHQHGDEVLRKVARALETGRRSMDTVARYGGEEFCIILPEATRMQALEIAKRCLEGLQEASGVTMSFGVATFPDDAQSPTELVHCADLAMLKAKSLGKNRVQGAHEQRDS
jgi:diguanylate cyclase (GGDEF)-like protein